MEARQFSPIHLALAQSMARDMKHNASQSHSLHYAVSAPRLILPQCGEHGVVEPALDNLIEDMTSIMKQKRRAGSTPPRPHRREYPP